MIPFFVVDRPISLDIIKGYWSSKSAAEYGLVSNALTTDRFRRLLARYPCSEEGACFACGASQAPKEMCEVGVELRGRVTVLGDSGIFADDRRLTYDALFDRYEGMNADYGAAVDFLADPNRTVNSAKDAVKRYESKSRNFQLVLVAQGKTLDEYVDCYRELRNLGDFPIAIGGMLRRKARSARYVQLGQAKLLEEVLTKIRSEFCPEWLFVFGVYHPDRHKLLSQLGATGADYKGWIFNYEHRRDLLSKVLSPVKESEAALGEQRLIELLNRRESLIRQLDKRSKALRGSDEPGGSESSKTRRKGTLRLISRIDETVLASMKNLASEKELTPADQESWNLALQILQHSDRQVRFGGVHDYFEQQVFPNLAPESDTSWESAELASVSEAG